MLLILLIRPSFPLPDLTNGLKEAEGGWKGSGEDTDPGRNGSVSYSRASPQFCLVPLCPRD